MVIKNLLTNKGPDPEDFPGESHQIFKEETPIPQKARKYRRKKHFPTDFIRLALSR